ncbi:MAG: hypothetical protein J6W52_02770 [Bacteroidaceae bacterium]|nr:hypothetical protein [Bacteroidaceae bacterium]
MKKLFFMVMAVAAISFASCCGNKTDKAEACGCDSCVCNPCECGQCKCDPCECDPCECGKKACEKECDKACQKECDKACEKECDKACEAATEETKNLEQTVKDAANEAVEAGKAEAGKAIDKGAEAAKKELGL